MGVPGAISIRGVTENSISIAYNMAPNTNVYTLEIFQGGSQIGQDVVRTANQARLYTFTVLSGATAYVIFIHMDAGGYASQQITVYTSEYGRRC